MYKRQIPYITIKAFEKGIFEKYTDGIDSRLCNTDDVLIVWDGARSGLVGTGVSGAIGSTLAKINHQNLNSKYLFYFLQLKFDYINKNPRGIGIPHVDPDIFWNIEFPLCSIHQQKVIVSKIEELFTKLEAGVASIKQTQEHLQTYQQALLKAAFEGKLTKNWRKQQKELGNYDISNKDLEDYIQITSIILEEISEERRKKWENLYIRKQKKKGRIPKNNNWKNNYKILESPNTNDLPNLPFGWKWVFFDEIAELIPNAIKAGPFGSTLKKSSYVKKGSNTYKIYGQEQVLRQNHKFGDYYINEDKYRKLKSCKVKPGDILISLVGTIGKVLILPKDCEDGIINPRLVKLSLDKRIIKPECIKYLLNSISAKTYFKFSSHGGTMDILNLTIIKSLPIPLPPLKEQIKILDEINEKISICNSILQYINWNIKTSSLLKQSILSKAFTGGLLNEFNDFKLEETLNDEFEKKFPNKNKDVIYESSIKQKRLTDFE